MERLSCRVVIVDNDPVFLKLASEFFSREGHEVMCAESGTACLDMLQDCHPDIIFIDLIMPEMGGDDLCRAIRNLNQFSECRIVIVSAVASEQEIDIRSCGADGCIAKGPFRNMRDHFLHELRVSQRRFKKGERSVAGYTQQLQPRQITQELLQRNYHIKLILESMSQGVVELSSNRVVYMNRAGGDMLDVSFNDVVGLEIERVFPPPLYGLLRSEPAGQTSSGQRRLPSTLHFHDRQLVVEDLALEGHSGNRIILLSDITESKRMEAVIEAANLTENLGYVFSGIRHEIGNPVNSIKMALSVLQRNLAEYDQETVADFLDRTLQEVARIEYLLKSLKNYSLFEKPVVERIELGSFLRDFIALSRNDMERKNIRFRTIIADDNLSVCADGRALHHVLLNLLTNAVDALEDCEEPQITISCMQSNGQVVIKVDDNGKGIAESDLQNLFKPFFTSKSTGTGLGLVIVKKMLSAMNGSISIESYHGLGTTVSITLPGGVDGNH